MTMCACWFNENGISSVVLLECRVYGPQCAYVYFVDVYDMYTSMWACAHFLFVFSLLCSSFLQGSLFC